MSPREETEPVITTRGGLDIRLFGAGSPCAADLLRELHDGILRPSFRPEEYVSTD